jgi:DNA-binding CsgD family transcriptional regulator
MTHRHAPREDAPMPTAQAAPLDTAAARRARRELAVALDARLDQDAVLRRAMEAISGAVAFDASGWCTTDPATLLWTGGFTHAIPAEAAAAFFDNEIRQPDALKFTDLMRRPGHAGLLSSALGGDLTASPRYRTMYRPHGLADELRLALVAGGACWGTVCLLREEGAPRFTDAEIAFLAATGRQIAHGLRAALLPSADECLQAPGGPGLVIVAPCGSIETMNAEGERWLAELEAPAYGASLPPLVLSVRARAANLVDDPAPPRARAWTSRGWVSVHASALGDGRTAVFLEPARPAEIAPIVAHAYDLTDREREVLGLLLRGADMGEMAAALVISEHTARNHVKSVQRKLGVRSRAELQAKFFEENYQPWVAEVAARN